MMLEVRDLTVTYGPIVAVRDASLAVDAGHIVALIGSNGAGKTSLLRGLMGQVRVRQGAVLFGGDDVTRMRPHRLVRKGITIVPQNRGTLSPLSVMENLELAGIRLQRRERTPALNEVFDMFPSLYKRREVKAGLLSGGEQQMLAFGRAIVTQPKVLLLDEPSTGLAPIMTTEIMKSIAELSRRRSVATLVVEQNVAAVLQIAEYAYVLAQGRITRQGPSNLLRDDDEVRAAFIGA